MLMKKYSYKKYTRYAGRADEKVMDKAEYCLKTTYLQLMHNFEFYSDCNNKLE